MGAGIIGLSLALELRRAGADVLVVERGRALDGATGAAAGMLAVNDPFNPPALLPLARYSRDLYPEFLRSVEALSGEPVPFQTGATWQYLADGRSELLSESSLDPRQLGPALLAAVLASSVEILEHTAIATQPSAAGVSIITEAGRGLRAEHIVHTTGAWTEIGSIPDMVPVWPRKGQMLRVAMPAEFPLSEVHRAEHVYAVPRTSGPQAGSALIGATVEDAGFDTSVELSALQRLRDAAASLSPLTAFARDAPLLQAWAGLRPGTRDGLPLIGKLREREWIASGHFRNGILLAPGTARTMADLLRGRVPALDLAAFSPFR